MDQIAQRLAICTGQREKSKIGFSLMESAQEFMESFLREKANFEKENRRLRAPLVQKFYAKELAKHSQDSYDLKRENPEKLEMAVVSGESAQMITSENSRTTRHRLRYRLEVFDGRWKIQDIQFECWACKATGKRGQSACQYCEGAGWKSTFRN